MPVSPSVVHSLVQVCSGRKQGKKHAIKGRKEGYKK